MVISLPKRDNKPQAAQMIKVTPIDPDSFKALEGDTKIPDPKIIHKYYN